MILDVYETFNNGQYAEAYCAAETRRIYLLEDKPVPAGPYKLEAHVVKHGPLKGYQTFALVNPELGVFHEPGDAVHYMGPHAIRTACLFVHPGNWLRDTEGCFLAGLEKNVPALGETPNLGYSDTACKSVLGLLRPGDTVFIHQIGGLA